MAGVILPEAMLGILGGGQLGRMFASAAKTMGYRVTVLDPDPNSPAAEFADVHLCAAYDDEAALKQLADTCAAVTTEFENVNAESMRYLAQSIPVSPSGACVAIAQDRRLEKKWINQAGLSTAPYLVVEHDTDLRGDLTPYLPGILKTSRLGYDGKGQIRVSTPEEARTAFAALKGQPCLLEKRLALKTEVSVIVNRLNATTANTFPVAENEHADGILDVSIVPARVPEALAQQARSMAQRLADELDYVGVLAVEFFVLEDDSLVVNEMAPRPHNSGHYTLDATASSQFQQQVRLMCGLPPAETTLLSPVVMVNLLGDVWKGQPQAQWTPLLADPSVHLHLYGKKEARIGRKMGHFNVLAAEVHTALDRARSLQKTFK